MLLSRVSQWKLDENSGTTSYDSWGTNNGIRSDITGACDATHCPQIQTSGCISGNCLSFDGVNDYVDCGNGDDLDITGTLLTMSAWFYSTDQDTGYILAKNLSAPADIQYAFYVDASYTRINIYINGAGVANSNTGSIVTNKWNNTTIIYNGTNIAIYINGVLARTPQAYSTPISSTNHDLSIGRRQGGVYFKGLIDDVRIYDEALLSSEVQSNYYLGINKLFLNNGIVSIEFMQRLTELKSNLVKNE